jgi:hypothetical protein
MKPAKQPKTFNAPTPKTRRKAYKSGNEKAKAKPSQKTQNE